MKKKILINCYEYPPSIHGGVGSFTRDLAEGAVKLGINVHVIGVYNPILLKLDKIIDENINGVRVIRIPQSNFPIPQLKVLIDRLKLFIIIKRLHKIEKYDILESPESTGWFPLFIPVRPFIVRLHGAQVFFDNELKRKGSRLGYYLEKRTIKNADSLIAVSNYCGNKTLSLLKINKEFKTIYNGIDIDKIDSQIKAKKNSNTIVFANSVIKKKGVEELIKAFNLIGNDIPEFKLIIIGKSLGLVKGYGNYIDYLKTLIEDQLQDRVIFTGWLATHSSVIEYLSSANVCVYPSHMEGQGIAPTEAMALRKPVIFMNNGPGPEVITNNYSGLLVNTKSPQEIATAIITIIKNNELAEKFGINAREAVENKFNKKLWLEKNMEFYKNLLN